ncbi:MAG TPA: MBL fold metallo-hydrolase [Nevskiaceae bacterium]|nr:MBL fold metallo-hydrolase [Nevskiaceae bacterium]
MKIERLIVGQLQTNCYLAWDEERSEAVIIDPGDDADFIIRKIQDLKIQPIFIVATHGHFDHVLAVTELKLAYLIPFLMHKADLFLLKKSGATAQYFTEIRTDPILPPDKFVKEGDLIKFGKEKLKVIETPGHTPGSIALFTPGILFSGDTVFAQGVGRTDFSYASSKKLKNSLKKLFQLPEKTVVYPGHGPTTTIGKKITIAERG